MLEDTTPTSTDKISVAEKFATAAKKATKPKPVEKFNVRMGTVAVCNFAVGGDAQAGCLFQALAELWVDTKRKIERPYHGGFRGYLFLTLDQLATLTGLSDRTIRERAIHRLRERGFFTIKRGRVSRHGANMYQIHFDEAAFWTEIVGLISDGAIDRAKLPYLFKRIYDSQIGE